MKLCDYGCGRLAIKQFGNGKWCCSKHYLSCPGIIKLREQTVFNKYGVNNINQVKDIKDKAVKTCEEKYGGNGYAGACGVKSRNTTEEIYGFKHATSAPVIKKKRINTFIEKYGVTNPSQIEEVKQKKEITCMKNYGVLHPMYSKKIKNRLMETVWDRYGVKWPGQIEKSRKIAKERMLDGGAVHANKFISNPSKPQVELWKLCQELFPLAILNYPCYKNNYSIDIALPHLAVAIEYDGSYWHQDSNADQIRQKNLEMEGWRFVRYIDRIPSKQELLRDVLRVS